jgi:hypothetical protein
MEKEVYELIDTALKIGLGALVSGGTAFLLAKSNFNRSQVSEKRERHINFLQDIANGIESARINHEKSSHPFWYRISKSGSSSLADATKISLDCLSHAVSDIGKARAAASLLGLDSIRIELIKAEGVLENIFELVAKSDATKIADNLNSKSSQFRSALDKALSELSEVYENA